MNIQIPEDTYWEGMGKQKMDFHQVLGELVDNAVSASGYDEDGDLRPFKIEVTIQRIGNRIRLKVADESIGISLNDLENKILNPGGRGSTPGPLNEHGFGLKNALCVLTQGNILPFKIQTRDLDAIERDHYYVVHGPFRTGLEVDLDKRENWNVELRHVTGEIGTRVYAETTYHFFNTLYRRGRYFEDPLITRLAEHLGVMYRGFLRNKSNKLWLRWQNQGGDQENPNILADWEEARIKPIEIPYSSEGCTEMPIKITHEGTRTTVLYRHGLLDEGKVQDTSSGRPYPLKIYYQGNIPTQGIDVRVRGRVVQTSLLSEIWAPSEIMPHNDFNDFVGELILDAKFRTVNNKISIDPHNLFWEKLLDKLNEPDFSGMPQRITRAQVERDVKERIKAHLEGYYTGSTVRRNHSVWPGTGVKIDLYHQKPSGEIDIYEVKTGTARPIDVYQLVMYWDGLVDGGQTPSLGRIVAENAPDSVNNMIASLNNRTDARGNNYKLEFKTIQDLLGSSR